MAFSPAWGGFIPVVPIGSFRDFYRHKRDKRINEMFTGTITRTAVAAAVRSPAGRRAVSQIAVWLKAAGLVMPQKAIGIELQQYMEFMKFQHRVAVNKRNREAQLQVERIMGMVQDFPRTGARSRPQALPDLYFKIVTTTTGGPRTDEDERRKSVVTWFERRKRRKGRLVNV